MKQTFRIYGSDEDLHAFEKMFKESGFDKCLDAPTQSSGFPPVPSIKYDIALGIGNCIKKILSTRHQCLARRKNGEQMVLKGDLSADEIERLLKCSRHFDIENEISSSRYPVEK